ncbi:primosomal protein N' [Candidatus Rhabdochlamydia sp. T3358]|uniref:replication restart helicase PriA n=1 Tax=Candidatus Rhabdochlamydia sp. T3358 TaxID=2099795 RepID=UPI0010B5484D|nr:primosomal protein N' [Candidatus Rhabdochlamydia sp. T3358]VHO02117.1 Primosomal protein N' [Candidatus Rhabdochlamydia sp. T3358]
MSDLNSGSIVSVILDQAINMTLDYKICLELIGRIHIGSRVKVPLQGSTRLATVIEIKQTTPIKKLREIIELLDTPVLPKDLVSLAKWMAHYYCCPLRKVLQVILPPSVRKDTGAKQQLFIKPLLDKSRLKELCESLRLTSPTQAEVVSTLLQAPKGLLLSELMEKANVSRSPIDTLVKKNILSCSSITIDRSKLLEWEFFRTKPKSLNPEQAKALESIKHSLNTNQFQTHLLYGVTGSGKTEVYLQAIQHALEQGKSIIFLVPEIALTSQTIERLRSRFLQKLAILHYRLSTGEKRDAWHNIAANTTPIVIGARSAVFSPACRLGLIIVDEEHESSYKQTEESPRYHARDIAVMRAKLNQATVILGSATPSLESYQNTLLDKYHLNTLSKRADKAHLPQIQIVDMRPQYQKAKGFTLFSEILIEKIKQKIALGEQVLLFLNRRGYHTSQLCLNCSYVVSCPHCDISLTFYLKENQFSCHLCDFCLPPPKSCPKCHAEGQLKFKGVGTELVERSLKALLPEAHTLRIDRDTTRHKGSHEILLKQFRTGKADVLIGTQMIAKGLHFPLVTLVGVLMADSNLQIPDFRASETTFQLLTQVAGRSGRGSLLGEVIIQTLLPEHMILSLAQQQNFEGFFAQEIQTRQLFFYPPFTRLVKLVFSGKTEFQVVEYAEKIRKDLIRKLNHCEILPLIACGHAKIKDMFRYQFLIKAKKLIPILPQLHQISQHKEIKLSIDVDPLSTFF